MLESSGSILQRQPRVTALASVNLLIVTNKSDNLKAITTSLHQADISFTYDIVDSEQKSENLRQQKYSAILYDYIQDSEDNTVDSLVEKLRWWFHLYPNTPLILIADALGDEAAVELIQSGVAGYVLRHKLHKLPQTLRKSLFNFVSQQTLIKQQQNLIIQQQQEIELLKAEKQEWEAQRNARQEHIAHLVHELRNPIAAIIGFASALKEQYYGKLNPKQAQYAGLLVDSGKHLEALVKNYLDITKIDANKQVLELERIAVVEICEASIMTVADKAQAKELTLNYHLADGIDFCKADSMRLKQILINLLSNAIKFTEHGSVTLKVSLKEDQLHFAVIDTGIGISKQNLIKLFHPFPQISNHHENTGLGLTLSKKLAELHGGDITVVSELGKGSCFTLIIPVNAEQ